MIIIFGGETGSGKTALAKRTAEKFNCKYFTLSVFFRTCAYIYLKSKGNLSVIKTLYNGNYIQYLWDGKNISLYLCGTDITKLLDNPDIGNLASKLSTDSYFYNIVCEIIKKEIIIPSENEKIVVIEGRDARHFLEKSKVIEFFVFANPDVKAARRKKDNPHKKLALIKSEIIKRDKRDAERVINPVRPSEQSILLDNSSGSIEEKIKTIIKHIDNLR